MGRLLLVFFVLFFGFFFGIPFYQNLTGKAKSDLTRLVIYSIICSLLALIVMTLIVITF
jgi:hypothetical protein